MASVIADLIRNPEGGRTGHPSLHAPQHRHSRVGGNLWGAVIGDSPLDPEEQGDAGEQDNTNRQNPLSLDGRGIKGEGENDAPHYPNPVNPRSVITAPITVIPSKARNLRGRARPPRHCELDLQSTGQGHHGPSYWL